MDDGGLWCFKPQRFLRWLRSRRQRRARAVPRGVCEAFTEVQSRTKGGRRGSSLRTRYGGTRGRAWRATPARRWGGESWWGTLRSTVGGPPSRWWRLLWWRPSKGSGTSGRGRVLQGRAPRHHVLSRVRSRRRTAHSRTEHRSFPRASQAEDKAPRQEGGKTASRAAQNIRKQPAFANKCDARDAGLRTAGGAAVRRDERLAVIVLQNNSTAEKGVRDGGRSQGKLRNAAPPASQACQADPVETRRRGTSTAHTTHQHRSWANNRGRGQQQGACQWQHFIRQKNVFTCHAAGKQAVKHSQGSRLLHRSCIATTTTTTTTTLP